MPPSATAGRNSPSLQIGPSNQQQKEVPSQTSSGGATGQEGEGRGATEAAMLAAAAAATRGGERGGESLLTAKLPHALSRHETESEGIGSSVTSEDTITEDTLQEWSKEVPTR